LDGHLSDIVHFKAGVIILDYPGAGKVHEPFMLDFATYFLTGPSAKQAVRRNNNVIWRPNYDNRSSITAGSTQQDEESFPDGVVGDPSKDRHKVVAWRSYQSPVVCREGAACRFSGVRKFFD
jgi:hypothetical protein